ncbi:MAG: hypothetical protein ACI4LC_00090 [Emergencia sp.]
MKKGEKLSRCLLEIGLCLTIIQGMILGIKQIAFNFMDEELFSRSMVTMISMIVGIVFLCEYKRKRDIEFALIFGSVFPASFSVVAVTGTENLNTVIAAVMIAFTTLTSVITIPVSAVLLMGYYDLM